MKRSLLIILIIQLSLNLSTQAKTVYDSIPSGKNFEKAAFSLWFPDNYKTIRGIILLVPGSNSDGRSLVKEASWQELAMKYNFALIGCYFTDKPHVDMNVEEYANAKDGSGQALLDCMAKFAVQTGFHELITIPVVLWGHSAGGEFNYEFVCWKPERVLAFVVNKGGFYYSALAPKPARNVPGIIFTGENDMESRKDILKGIFSINRRAGAIWTFAEEPGAGHEPGKTQKLAQNFFDNVIPLRLHNNNTDKNSKYIYQPLLPESGFAGDKKNKRINPVTNNQLTDFSISWLPTETFAHDWLEFISGN